jgi:dihydroxyacid dehydratase/phosphogluconate dehydratase
LFGLTQNAGMGWTASEVARDPYLILSTQGGLRAADGQPIALGYHTGHWEIGLLVQEAAEELRRLDVVPFAGMVSDPCYGRTQGTAGMMDSLPYRNDAAIGFRRLIRSLPRRKGVLGIATCDKGLPAMMMALAGSKHLPCVLVPGGVTLPPREGEDAGKVQSIGARYAHGELTLPEAAELGCRACASPGGGCQFLGTAATSQVVAEAMGLTVPHAALSPSDAHLATWPVDRHSPGRPVLAGSNWVRSSRSRRSVTRCRPRAFGGSTNLILHVPATRAAGCR